MGIHLQPWLDDGSLRISSVRPTAYGLEMHIAQLVTALDAHSPRLVALDAITSLAEGAAEPDVRSVLTREVDLLKNGAVTTVLTSLGGDLEPGTARISSLVDTWLQVRNVESNGEHNRLLFVRKSRGTAHSNQVREFVVTSGGLELVDVPVGPEGAVVGSARLAFEAARVAAAARRAEELVRRRQLAARRRAEIEAQILSLRTRLEEEAADLDLAERGDDDRDGAGLAASRAMSAHRWADDDGDRTGSGEPG